MEPVLPENQQKRAVIDTVRTILASKGGGVAHMAPSDTVYEGIAEMARLGIGALLVVDSDHLVGIMTERDYARKVILQGRSSRETLVHEIMTPSPFTVTPDHTVDDCMRIMTHRRIRHLPVLEEGKLAGIISIGDLVKAIISAQAYTIDQLHFYIAAGYPA